MSGGHSSARVGQAKHGGIAATWCKLEGERERLIIDVVAKEVEGAGGSSWTPLRSQGPRLSAPGKDDL